MSQEEKVGVPDRQDASIESVAVPVAMVEDGVVFYVVNVNGALSRWAVKKRYSQFEALHNQLIVEVARPLPKSAVLPQKRFKLFTSHTEAAFIEERRVLLDNYLKKLLRRSYVKKAKCLATFFTTDTHSRVTDVIWQQMPEDVEVTGISIPGTKTMSDHVLYQIDVTNSNKSEPYANWTVLKRFGQFYDMDGKVRASFSDNPKVLSQLAVFPPRKSKLFNDHLSQEFVEERRVLLESYLKRMIRIEAVVRNSDFLLFLQVT